MLVTDFCIDDEATVLDSVLAMCVGRDDLEFIVDISEAPLGTAALLAETIVIRSWFTLLEDVIPQATPFEVQAALATRILAIAHSGSDTWTSLGVSATRPDLYREKVDLAEYRRFVHRHAAQLAEQYPWEVN